jgi:hypothetical protein
MLERIRKYLRDAKRAKAEHESAWAHVLSTRPDDSTPFQAECLRRVEAVLESRGLELSNRRSGVADVPWEPASQLLVFADVPVLGAELWFYKDQTNISAPEREFRLEHYDVRDPSEYYERLESFVLSLPLVEGAA